MGRPPDKRKPGLGTRADATTRPDLPPSRIDEDTDSVDQALAEIRRWERAARLVADDPALTLKRKCFALLEMMALARRSELAAFLETAVWRGCRHLFDADVRVPTDTIGAIRALLRRGLDSCPTCRRPLPNHDELDRWRRLSHDSMTRRSA
jgi:hypothetical protein